MPYKISGSKSETTRIIVLKESDWSIESNTLISGSGDYEVTGLEEGNKTVLSRNSDGWLKGFGAVTSIFYDVAASDTLWAWGYGGEGNLGLGDIDNRSVPTQVGSLADWSTFTGGDEYSIAIKTDGTLWSWGANWEGELAQGNLTHYSSPVQVGSLTDWESLSHSCGRGTYSTAAIKTDGTLWTWGENGQGQLGHGDTADRSSPVQVGALTTWARVASAVDNMGAIKTDGTLWVCGDNYKGQLGQGDTTDKTSLTQVGVLYDWHDIVFGRRSAVAIKTDGTLWSWGYNLYGQLGQGDRTDRSSPTQIGSLTDWAKISAGYYHISAIKQDGTLWVWGYNSYGQLGTGNTTMYSSPVQVGALTNWSEIISGSNTMAAIKQDGTLWAWGYGGEGQLGGGSTSNASSPIQVGTLSTWSKVFCAADHVLAITGDNPEAPSAPPAPPEEPPPEPEWHSYLDDTFWESSVYETPNGEWDEGNEWWAADYNYGYQLRIVPKGGWETDFRPTKLKVTWISGNPVAVYLTDGYGGDAIVYAPNSTSEQELTCDFGGTGDIGELVMAAADLGEAYDFEVTNIEFLY